MSTTILVWILVVTSHVHNGQVITTFPQSFPTVEECQRIGNYTATLNNRTATYFQCLQATIVK
jgi:hypothetical protein